jgi:hypothetical protein
MLAGRDESAVRRDYAQPKQAEERAGRTVVREAGKETQQVAWFLAEVLAAGLPPHSVA